MNAFQSDSGAHVPIMVDSVDRDESDERVVFDGGWSVASIPAAAIPVAALETTRLAGAQRRRMFKQPFSLPNSARGAVSIFRDRGRALEDES